MQAVTIEQFPGLDLRGDPGDTPGAIDLLNVTLEQGRVRSRDGATSIGNNADVAGMCAVAHATAPQLIIAAPGTNGLKAMTPAGASVGAVTLASVTTKGVTGAAIGTPSAPYLFVSAAPGTGASDAQRWNGAAWAAAPTLPAAIRTLCANPSDNRLVVGAADSKLSFSDAGAPETYGANNYVLLTPGDGEDIHGSAAYNNQVFVFKRRRFFVFYGTSTDSAGQPVFNYRAVDTGIGMAGHAPQAVCSGPDGVYFIADDGIYRTAGGPPVLISAALDPFFRRSAHTLWQGSGYIPSTVIGRLAWAQGKLYAFLPNNADGTGLTFVYDPQLQAWTAWGLTALGLVSFPDSSLTGDASRLMAATLGKVVFFGTGVTTDAGAAIVSRYRSSFAAFGTPGQKRIRETILEGTGTPTVRWSRDWGSLVTGAAVTLGATPAVATGRQRLAIRGREFSFQVGAASGAWALNRVQANVDQQVRPVGVTGA